MKLSRRKKKRKNRNSRYGWERLSHNTVIIQTCSVEKEEINAIAISVFGGLNVSSKDL
jgi:hypothetical protein